MSAMKSDDAKIEISNWGTAEELRGMVELWKACFPDFLDRAIRSHTESPYVDRRYTWLLKVNGQVVSHVRIQPNFVRIGRARLWVGGIAGVATHPDFRNGGFASRLMNHVVEVMRDEGFDISILFGIPNFYHRFGYLPMLPTYRMHIDVKVLTPLKRRLRVRRCLRRDAGRAMTAQKRWDAGTICSVLRTAQHWRYGSLWRNLYLVEDGAGRLRGMVRIHRGEKGIFINEVACADDAAVFETILALCRDLAKRSGIERLNFELPPDNPFSIFCTCIGAELEITYRPSGGGSGRIINLQATFRKMLPEWEERLRRVKPRIAAARLLFKTESEEAVLDIGRRGVRMAADRSRARTINIPQAELLRLVMGYCDSTSIGLKFSEKISEILEILFPRRFPHIWAVDRF